MPSGTPAALRLAAKCSATMVIYRAGLFVTAADILIALGLTSSTEIKSPVKKDDHE